MKHAVVVGAGVNGLTVAHGLARAGLRVRVLARETGEGTTSSVSAAMWYPYEAFPTERVVPWAFRSLAVFRELARDPVTGVRFCDGLDLFPETEPRPAWLRELEGYADLAGAELPDGYADGCRFPIPVVEMPLYLPWLAERASAAGATIEEREVCSLEEVAHDADVVVNCTGLGAGSLCDDHEVFPIRGQVVRVAQPAGTGVERWQVFRLGSEAFGYVIPRSRDVVLGGTNEPGRWSTEPDDAVSALILERCREPEPRLADEVLGVRVGLRPGRTTVRLEEERLADGTHVVHDYGHGGAGVTLSIGCAEEVVRLVTGGQ
jgi:D-amino-acid oxidase